MLFVPHADQRGHEDDEQSKRRNNCPGNLPKPERVTVIGEVKLFVNSTISSTDILPSWFGSQHELDILGDVANAVDPHESNQLPESRP